MFFVIAIALSGDGSDSTGTLFILGIVLFALFLFLRHKSVVQAQENYEQKKEYHYEQVKRAKEQYQKTLIDYNKQVASIDSQIEEAKREKETQMPRYEFALSEIKKLSSPLSQAKEVLEKLYALDYIFPKYRSFVSISSIYEYFASGRCTELTGPNGAYNLYEAELRQNIIIGKLESILSNLEIIKDNQYVLYREMKKANQAISEIAQDVQELVSVADSSRASLDITAKCAEAAQKNTEAIKYLTLINGVHNW